jgi:hypothetical protein
MACGGEKISIDCVTVRLEGSFWDEFMDDGSSVHVSFIKASFKAGASSDAQWMTRKTEELKHERLLLTVILVLSQTVIGYLYIYGDCSSAHSSCKATDTDLYIFISDGKHVFGCSVEQTDHSVEQRLSLVYRGDPS